MRIKCRDDYIRWNNSSKIDKKRLNNIGIASTIVPVQPFGYNMLLGKLLACLCSSETIRDDWENRFRLRVGSIDMEDMTARIRRQTKGGISDGNNKGTRLEDQKTQKYSLGGDHLLGELKLDWKVSYSEASEDRPDERYVRYEQKDVPFSSLNISNPERPYFAWTGNCLLYTSDAADE